MKKRPHSIPHFKFIPLLIIFDFQPVLLRNETTLNGDLCKKKGENMRIITIRIIIGTFVELRNAVVISPWVLVFYHPKAIKLHVTAEAGSCAAKRTTLR